MIVELLKYKTWSTTLGSSRHPTDWGDSPAALTGDDAGVISIRLDY